MRCKHLRRVGYQEWECDISGVSVGAECASVEASPCLPRKAVMVRAGMLRLEKLPGNERRAVADLVRKLARNEVPRERGDMAEGAKEQPSKGGLEGVSLEALTSDELDNLVKQARTLRMRRARQARAVPRLEAQRAKLIGQRVDLQKRIGSLDEAIDAIREGRPVDLAAATGRSSRGRGQGSVPRPAGKGAEWTPKRRAEQSRRMKDTLARARAEKAKRAKGEAT